ncbi:MAG: hypothetical protein D6720_11360 [Gammaproteobacteria bacterium]|nr:MAG: hypothetical protein D6720_11360 [Gammaproteobacteria bacterium]
MDFLNPEAHRKDEVAIEIDLAAGVLERCDVCRTLFDRGHDERLPTADALALELFDRDDPRVAIFKGDRDDLLRRLRTARKPIPYSCLCENTG